MPAYNIQTRKGVIELHLWPFETKRGLELRVFDTPTRYKGAINGRSTLADINNYVMQRNPDGSYTFRNRISILRRATSYFPKRNQ